MDGSEADGEWSEGTDEAIKSESDSETEMTSKPKQQKIIKITKPKISMQMDAKNKGPHSPVKYISVDDIMDRIDQELYTMTSVQPPVSIKMPKKQKRLSHAEKAGLREQGVEFDTGDETEGLTKGEVGKHIIDIRQAKAHSDKDGTDTGLGSGSHLDELISVDMDHGHLQGQHTEPKATAETQKKDNESESEEEVKVVTLKVQPPQHYKNAESDLDSDTAHQIETKFEEIMKRKRAQQISPKFKRPFAVIRDADSVKTEDFEKAVKKAGVKTSDVLPSYLRHRKGSDADSVKTEEFEYKFKQSMVKDGVPQHIKHKTKPVKVYYRPKPKPSSGSDVDSVKTEDFEHKFKQIMIKQVAGVPVTSFDATTIDSDVDVVKTQMVQEKFRDALNTSAYKLVYEDSDFSEADEQLQWKRKYNEQGDSDYDVTSTKAAAGSPERNYQARTRHVSVIRDVISREKNPNKNHKYPHQRGDLELEDDYYDNDDAVSATSIEIEKESARIKKEMERERKNKFKMASTPKNIQSGHQVMGSPDLSVINNTPKKSDNGILKRKTAELDTITNTIAQARQEKQSILRELQNLQDTLKKTQLDIRTSEKQAKENRVKAEDTRSQLMLAEFKRDNAAKELSAVNEELTNKTLRIKELEAEVKVHQAELRQFESLGMSRQDVLEAVRERNELRAKLRGGNVLELERDELERQLDATKEDLFHEQKRSRVQLEELQEELESSQQLLEETQSQRETLQEKLIQVQNQLDEAEREKEQMIKSHITEAELAHEKAQCDLLEVKRQTKNQIGELKEEIQREKEKLENLQSEVTHKDELNLTLRDQLIDLQQDMSRETELKDSIIEDKENKIRKLTKDKEEDRAKIQETAELDKKIALQELRGKLEKEKLEALSCLEEKINLQINEHKHALIAKDEELKMTRERLRQQEEATRQLGEKLRNEAQEQVRKSVAKERELWDAEKDRLLRRELSNMQEETARSMARMKDELDHEKSMNSQLHRQINALKEELEEQKRLAHQAFKDKLTAVSQTKESLKEEQQSKLHEARDMYEKEKMWEIDALRETIRKQEEELKTLRSERQLQSQQSREVTSHLDRIEKTVVHEVNEECRKIANILGVTPRKVSVNSYRNYDSFNSSFSPGKSPTYRSPTKNPTTAALANLRACCEELRGHLQEVKQELDSAKFSTRKTQLDMSGEIGLMKQRLEQEKEMELEGLKESLINEHIEDLTQLHHSSKKDKNLHTLLKEKDIELREIQQNMNKWKEATADALARKFEEELNKELEKRLKENKKLQRKSIDQQREIDRLEREVRRLSRGRDSPGKSPSADDTSTIRLLRHLQGRVQQLRTENTSLKLGSQSVSTPDLSLVGSGYLDSFSTNDSYVQSLERRLHVAEQKAKQAEENQLRQHQKLNDKVSEINNLQTTLAHQTKELMQMERSYSQMKNRSPSPSRSPPLRSPVSRFATAKR